MKFYSWDKIKRLKRAKDGVPTKNVPGSGTVGLDHVVFKGYTPLDTGIYGLTFDNVMLNAETWQAWRNAVKRRGLKGDWDSPDVVMREVANAREPVLAMQTDNDYLAVRRMMVEGGMYVSPFDTITPEDITDGPTER